MKVTRLKRGYRIHLTDLEYKVLQLMVSEGHAITESGADYLTEKEKDAVIDVSSALVEVPLDDRR